MDFTKLVKAALDSPRQELSGCGLGFVVALTVFQEIIFCVLVLEKRSSCRVY